MSCCQCLDAEGQGRDACFGSITDFTPASQRTGLTGTTDCPECNEACAFILCFGGPELVDSAAMILSEK